jgi:hypothetical protein
METAEVKVPVCMCVVATCAHRKRGGKAQPVPFYRAAVNARNDDQAHKRKKDENDAYSRICPQLLRRQRVQTPDTIRIRNE